MEINEIQEQLRAIEFSLEELEPFSKKSINLNYAIYLLKQEKEKLENRMKRRLGWEQ